MGDLKRLILPAIFAIILHGFLVSLSLPKQDKLKPVLDGSSISIEINAFSTKTVDKKSEKKEEKKVKQVKKTEAIPAPIPPEITPEKEVVTPPIDVPKLQKKVVFKPERKKRKLVVEDRSKDSELLSNPPEKQVQTDKQPLKKLAVEKSELKESNNVTRSENIDNAPEKGGLNKKRTSTPIQKKAIPIYRQNKQPPYPLMAKRRGYEGEIVLNVLVDDKGRVSAVKIKQSSGHLSLDRAAMKTVKSWLFTPATEDGRPVPMWVDIPIDFQLR
jgi:protein TonB